MPPSPRWHRVESPPRPRIAPQDPPRDEGNTDERASGRHGLEAVGRATRVVAAHLADERAHREAVEPDQSDEQPAQGSFDDPHREQPPPTGAIARQPAHRDWRGRHVNTRRRAASKSDRRSAADAVAVAGTARMMRVVPGGRSASRSATTPRSRRAMRCRSTDPPTALDTTRPSRGGESPCRWAWITRLLVPARRPSAITRLNSARCRTRWMAAST